METRLSEHAFSLGNIIVFFQLQFINVTLRFDFIYLLLFCMVAKYRRTTLARSPDSPREHDIAAVYDHGFEISLWEPTQCSSQGR